MNPPFNELAANEAVLAVHESYWQALLQGQGPAPAAWLKGHPGATAELAGDLEVLRALWQATQVVAEDSRQDETVAYVPASEAAPAPSPAPGELVGGCRIIDRLGAGGMGEVYLAEHLLLGRKVAIKVMTERRATAPVLIERFLLEGRRLASLNYDHIVSVLDAGLHEGRFFLVMEYVAGRDLAQLVKESGRLDPWRAGDLIRQAALGLAHAHRHGFVHRDVKPANLLLTSDGKVKVADWELSRALHEPELTASDAVLGTAKYMAPEQAASARAATEKSDLYSLGGTFYYLLTGAAPPRSGARVRDARTDVPRKIARIVDQLLAEQPGRRIDSAQALADALERIRRPAPRAWLLLAAGVLVLAVGIGSWSMMTGKDARPAAEPPRAAAEPLRGSLDLLLLGEGNPRRRNLRLRDPKALPVKPGDQFQLEVSLSRPGFPYVVWIDPEGKAIPVYPWQPGHWGSRPAPEGPLEQMTLPSPRADDKGTPGWAIGAGPGGMETLVLMVRETPLPADIDLEKRFASLPPQHLQHPRAVVWFRDGEIIRGDPDRGPNFDVQRIDDPLLRLQERLRTSVRPLFDSIMSVSFANQGK